MRVEQYQKIYQWFAARPAARRWLAVAYHGTPLVVAAAYAALLLVQGLACLLPLWQGGSMPATAVQALVCSIAMPALVCALGTALRAALNAPRPYQQDGFIPLIAKDKIGHACPSRHVLSASVIALAWWAQSPAVACALFTLAVLIAALRVLAGVHSLRDVIAGLAFGIGAGLLVNALLQTAFAFL